MRLAPSLSETQMQFLSDSIFRGHVAYQSEPKTILQDWPLFINAQLVGGAERTNDKGWICGRNKVTAVFKDGLQISSCSLQKTGR